MWAIILHQHSSTRINTDWHDYEPAPASARRCGAIARVDTDRYRHEPVRVHVTSRPNNLACAIIQLESMKLLSKSSVGIYNWQADNLRVAQLDRA